jgi:hypothetical protein
MTAVREKWMILTGLEDGKPQAEIERLQSEGWLLRDVTEHEDIPTFTRTVRYVFIRYRPRYSAWSRLTDATKQKMAALAQGCMADKIITA